jgi:cob(I)alamin adenosyltransferase
MVRLSKIYTRTGDDGTTGLGDGARVPKTDARVEAYGTVDEANSFIGWAIVQAGMPGPSQHPGTREMGGQLRVIQNDMFDVGADLCCPIGAEVEAPGSRLRVTQAQVDRLEHLIDDYNLRLAPLDSFVLPGGTPLSSALHLARTAVRRAERLTVGLLEAERARTNPLTVTYLNRLSDLLFVLARIANDDGKTDVKWVPGGNR